MFTVSPNFEAFDASTRGMDCGARPRREAKPIKYRAVDDGFL